MVRTKRLIRWLRDPGPLPTHRHVDEFWYPRLGRRTLPGPVLPAVGSIEAGACVYLAALGIRQGIQLMWIDLVIELDRELGDVLVPERYREIEDQLSLTPPSIDLFAGSEPYRYDSAAVMDVRQMSVESVLGKYMRPQYQRWTADAVRLRVVVPWGTGTEIARFVLIRDPLQGSNE